MVEQLRYGMVTILAIVLGPILAVQAQKWIERTTEEKRERLFIFRTSMRTRGNILSRELSGNI
jgi:Family of unknown function (DUF6680)